MVLPGTSAGVGKSGRPGGATWLRGRYPEVVGNGQGGNRRRKPCSALQRSFLLASWGCWPIILQSLSRAQPLPDPTKLSSSPTEAPHRLFCSLARHPGALALLSSVAEGEASWCPAAVTPRPHAPARRPPRAPWPVGERARGEGAVAKRLAGPNARLRPSRARGPRSRLRRKSPAPGAPAARAPPPAPRPSPAPLAGATQPSAEADGRGPRGPPGAGAAARSLASCQCRAISRAYRSDELVRRFCSGSCRPRARSPHDLSLANLLHAGGPAAAPGLAAVSQPCCRPTSYEAVSFVGVSNFPQDRGRLSGHCLRLSGLRELRGRLRTN